MENSTLGAWHTGWFLRSIQLQCRAPFPSCSMVCKHAAVRRLQITRGLD